MFKYVLLVLLAIGLASYARWNYSVMPKETERAMAQLGNKDMTQELSQGNMARNQLYEVAYVILGMIGAFFLFSDLKELAAKRKREMASACLLLILFGSSGCYKPFEPIKLESVMTNEEAFLIPLTGDLDKQQAAKTEEFLEKNLVYVKQVTIPQQWVQKGYNWGGYNGEWRDAGVLIKVDKSPVTREWTADTNSGTSNRNEAIWVMTSDQVEFSTGWTCTARINGHKEAVKFLYNYPNGSLEKVMDHEIRAKLQADWTMEVTDLPMDELRKSATPHINKVIRDVNSFFEARGINITNLGITGGFVYKNETIQETMVKVFNSEQKKSIAMAESAAQKEQNVQINLEADAKAAAILKLREGEAKGIRTVADAKAYELEKAKANMDMYIQLKRIEIEKEKLDRWDGHWPAYFMASGDKGPDMLMQVPQFKPSDGNSVAPQARGTK
jgi:regulator of protease activity HflC (stomatin/prohibitin superfamily)